MAMGFPPQPGAVRTIADYRHRRAVPARLPGRAVSSPSYRATWSAPTSASQVLTADFYAQAGIRYADQMLTTSPQGADWRPQLRYYLGDTYAQLSPDPNNSATVTLATGTTFSYTGAPVSNFSGKSRLSCVCECLLRERLFYSAASYPSTQTTPINSGSNRASRAIQRKAGAT